MNNKKDTILTANSSYISDLAPDYYFERLFNIIPSKLGTKFNKEILNYFFDKTNGFDYEFSYQLIDAHDEDEFYENDIHFFRKIGEKFVVRLSIKKNKLLFGNCL